MKLVKALCVAGLVSTCTIAHADEAAEQEAAKLLNTLGISLALEQSMATMLDLQLKQNPSLTPFRGVMLEFFARYMSYDSVKPDLLKVYANAFTAGELQKINAFYATPVGQKTIRMMPVLMAQGAQIGAQRVQDNIGELQAMIEAEAIRLQQLQEEEQRQNNAGTSPAEPVE